jgi:O-methyltransferase domain
VFAEDGAGAYCNTVLSETLRTDAPVSMRGMARLIGLPCHLHAWDHFPGAVRGDGTRSVWEIAHGMPLFAYFAEHADDAAVFQQGMTAFSGLEARAVADAYDFGDVRTLVDVGGRARAAARDDPGGQPASHRRSPRAPVHARGRARAARRAWRKRAVPDRGRRLLRVGPRRRRSLLKNIVHDFDDDQVSLILRRCRAATRDGGRLLIVQEALPPGNAPSFGKLLDLQMLLIGGRERTEAEYRALLSERGYELTRVIGTACPLHIIEATAC